MHGYYFPLAMKHRYAVVDGYRHSITLMVMQFSSHHLEYSKTIEAAIKTQLHIIRFGMIVECA